MPTQDDFEAAVAAARPAAAALGLSLHTEGLWAVLLKARAPMLAQLSGRRCTIAYAAYTPGRSFAWLFPNLPAPERQLWLAALVRHELAHCAEPAGAGAAASVAGGAVPSAREGRADLAFALYVDGHSGQGDVLIETLAALRARMAPMDAEHDTSQLLRCYLAHPLRGRGRDVDAIDGPLRLGAWQGRCSAAAADDALGANAAGTDTGR